MNARPRHEFQVLDESFTLTPTTREWALAAVALRGRLRKAGKPVRLAEFSIAAWATLHGTYVLTKNVKDFRAMGIDAREW